MTDYGAGRDDLDSELVDLSGLPLETICELPESALGVALRRALDAARQESEAFFNDYQENLT